MRPNLIRLAGSFLSSGPPRDTRRPIHQSMVLFGNRPMTASMSTSIPVDILKTTTKAKIDEKKFDDRVQQTEQASELTKKLLDSKDPVVKSRQLAQEHAKFNPIEVMDPEEAEKIRAEYTEQSAEMLIKDQGCGPVEKVSKELIYPYILKTRGQDLSESTITLCNFHDFYMADLLLKKGCKKVVLVEKSFDNSQYIKNEISKKYPDGKVVGLHGDTMLFFAHGKKRNARSYHRILDRTDNDKSIPLRLAYEEPSFFRRKSPLLIYSTPAPNQQYGLLRTLQRGILQNYAGDNHLGMFNYGHFEMITFLHAGNYVTLVCGVDPRMKFHAHATRRFSFLFNKLFAAERIDLDKNGEPKWTVTPRNGFSPGFLRNPSMAYEHRLLPLGIDNDQVIGVSIRSRPVIRIGGRPVTNDAKDNSKKGVLSTNELLKFAFFVSEVGLKENTKKSAEELFSDLWSETGRSVAKGLSLGKLDTLPNQALEEAFLELRSEIKIPLIWKVEEAAL